MMLEVTVLGIYIMAGAFVIAAAIRSLKDRP
jgi:hypothetical protein